MENKKVILITGSHLTGALEETTLEEIDAQMQLNFYGAVNMIKAAMPVMLEQKAGLHQLRHH